MQILLRCVVDSDCAPNPPAHSPTLHPWGGTFRVLLRHYVLPGTYTASLHSIPGGGGPYGSPPMALRAPRSPRYTSLVGSLMFQNANFIKMCCWLWLCPQSTCTYTYTASLGGGPFGSSCGISCSQVPTQHPCTASLGGGPFGSSCGISCSQVPTQHPWGGDLSGPPAALRAPRSLAHTPTPHPWGGGTLWVPHYIWWRWLVAVDLLLLLIRVADPWHFCEDPDPANQNFKNGSRIRILLIKKAHSFPVPHIFLLVLWQKKFKNVTWSVHIKKLLKVTYFVLLVGNIHIHFIYGSKGRIQIRDPDPLGNIRIRIWILQKGTDPTGSGSATLGLIIVGCYAGGRGGGGWYNWSLHPSEHIYK